MVMGWGGTPLREAITRANQDTTSDTITFSVTGTIALTSPLPDISKPLLITGPGPTSLTVSRPTTANPF